MTFTLIYGARPNAPKLAPIVRELERRGIRQGITGYRIISTGQHANTGLDIYDELGLPPPDARCIAKGSHAKQTSIVMQEVEEDLIAHRPDRLVVVGDVNSTLGAALAASKLGIKIAHVEAGLRSGDWSMPEEVNRVLVDELSDLWLCTEVAAFDRLVSRGWRKGQRAAMVGNVMIDSLHWALARPFRFARPCRVTGGKFADVPDGPRPDEPYAVVTLHRPSNVDTAGGWSQCVAAVDALGACKLNLVWPHHPRSARDRRMCDPLGYVEMVHALNGAAVVLTDSGGVQEETTALGVQCLTFRENTERPITVSRGTNVLVGTDPNKVAEQVRGILAGHLKPSLPIPMWDGHAAERIVDELLKG